MSPISESEPEDGDTTELYARKVTTKPVPQKPSMQQFKFKKFPISETNKDENSPKSSPVLLATPRSSPDVYIISSDEELEKSMVQLDETISLEMDSN